MPYRYMFPCALFFIAIGVYSTNNSLFEVNEVVLDGRLAVLVPRQFGCLFPRTLPSTSSDFI